VVSWGFRALYLSADKSCQSLSLSVVSDGGSHLALPSGYGALSNQPRYVSAQCLPFIQTHIPDSFNMFGNQQVCAT
jgi:hypothetical protein